MNIIGFGHRQQVGKDTACRLIVERFGKEHPEVNVQIVSFADKLYQICHDLYGWAGFKDREYYQYYPEEKEIALPEIGKSPRQILIDFGTEGVRKKVFEDTWVNYVVKRLHDSDLILIPDMRFPNEMEAVQANGGWAVNVKRFGQPHVDDAADIALAAERFQRRFDRSLLNVGSLSDLADEATKLAEEYYYAEFPKDN